MTALLSANATSLFSGWVRGLAGPQFPLARLPEHLPTALATAGLCQLVYLASFPLFRSASKLFTSLSKAKQIDWATRVVSTAFSSYAVFASLRTVNDPVLGADRLFGYTAAAGHLMAVALGYFIWDLVICMQHVKLFGPGFLVHAICCINIYLWIFKPFLMYFGVRVLLWEASVGLPGVWRAKDSN